MKKKTHDFFIFINESKISLPSLNSGITFIDQCVVVRKNINVKNIHRDTSTLLLLNFISTKFLINKEKMTTDEFAIYCY
jgi:hypothetical protein